MRDAGNSDDPHPTRGPSQFQSLSSGLQAPTICKNIIETLPSHRQCVCEDIISRLDTSVTDSVGFSTNCSFATSNHGDLESIAILVDEQCIDL